MVRIILASIITASVIIACNIASDTTAYLIVAALLGCGFLAGAFVMFAATFEE